MFKRLSLLLELSRYHTIGRRYFVVNGFDGALTMLGILLGFYQSEEISNLVVLSACLGAAIALGVSGISSAYISESAERLQELKELESAMVTNLEDSAHGEAARLTPKIIALINGFSPFLLSLLIIFPIWLDENITPLTSELLEPIELSMLIAIVLIFLLGVFLGKISSQHWFLSGVKTLLIALLTGGLILLLVP